MTEELKIRLVIRKNSAGTLFPVLMITSLNTTEQHFGDRSPIESLGKLTFLHVNLAPIDALWTISFRMEANGVTPMPPPTSTAMSYLYQS